MEVIVTDLLREYDQVVVDQQGRPEKVYSKARMSALLKELRKSKIQRSDIVLAWGPKLLNFESYIEVWNLREQIAIAALDQGEFDIATEHIQALQKQFPDSVRVNRIQGMLHEAKGQFQDAIKLYDELLKKDLTNIAIMKRKICIKKAQRNIKGVIEDINSLLNFFPSDVGSWLELGEIYITAGDYEAAAHCFEELVLLDPRCAHYHCRLAECLYSAGSESQLLASRKHYTISLTHQAPMFNTRALYGLVAACQAIQQLPSGNSNTVSEHEKKVNEELLRWSKDQLQTLVSNNAGNSALSTVASAIL